MDSRPVRVIYDQDIAPHDGNPARLQGETYGLADAETARKAHPFARIVGEQDEVIAQGETPPEPPVEVGPDDYPVWYAKLGEKAEKAGEPAPLPLYEGETRKVYEDRAAEAAKVAAEAAQADADALAAASTGTEGDSTDTGDQSGQGEAS